MEVPQQEEIGGCVLVQGTASEGLKDDGWRGL
jgi:hypothetical protein